MQKNGKIILLSFISFLLIAAIIVVVINKNGEVGEQTSNEEDKGTEKKEEEIIVEEKEPEQPSEEEENKVDNRQYIEGQPLPTEPTFVEGILIVNKHYPLPKDYAPGENTEARNAYDNMATDAKEVGFELVAFSTYRSFEYQQTLYDRYVAQNGQESADRFSARPGYSEHQTGLAFDIGEKGQEHLWLKEEFGETEVGKWLVDNAHKYGFILRFPKDKEHITGYMYESWHFRYLGIDLAQKVKESGLTLEEYLGID